MPSASVPSDALSPHIPGHGRPSDSLSASTPSHFLSLFSPRAAASSPSPSTSNFGPQHSYVDYSMYQRDTLRVIASVAACVSISAALLAVYWFINMRRNFRRDLVLLLIVSDLFKSLWFLIFSGYTFTYGDMITGSGFCQAGGYMLQASFEACDLAIFFMSLHMSLQIFPPANSVLGHDGLYRVRKWVLAVWFIVPNIFAALAFINGHRAYEAAGPFCALPVRPYWPRIALSWAPRYLVWLYIMWIAISIYRHVGKEFKVFGEVRSGSSSTTGSHRGPKHDISGATESSTLSWKTPDPPNEKSFREDSFPPDLVVTGDDLAPYSRRMSNVASSGGAASVRRPSAPDWTGSLGHLSTTMPSSAAFIKSVSAPGSRRGSQQIAAGVLAEDFAPPPNFIFNERRASLPVIPQEHEAAPLESINEGANSDSDDMSDARDRATDMMAKRRHAMQRQLRLLFIYPVVYIIIWIIPFVTHCLNYSNYFAMHPVFPLSALNVFCQTFLGSVDAFIFCWREKPWKHIPGSDGTFWGSFRFWTFVQRKEWSENLRRESRRPSQLGPLLEKKSRKPKGVAATLKRLSARMSSTGGPMEEGTPAPPAPVFKLSPSRPPVSANTRPKMHKRQRTGGSDFERLQVERAHERLALERLDYANRHSALVEPERKSSISIKDALDYRRNNPQTERKEWWDRQLRDQDLFQDDDEEPPDGPRGKKEEEKTVSPRDRTTPDDRR